MHATCPTLECAVVPRNPPYIPSLGIICVINPATRFSFSKNYVYQPQTDLKPYKRTFNTQLRQNAKSIAAAREEKEETPSFYSKPWPWGCPSAAVSHDVHRGADIAQETRRDQQKPDRNSMSSANK